MILNLTLICFLASTQPRTWNTFQIENQGSHQSIYDRRSRAPPQEGILPVQVQVQQQEHL